MSVLYVVWQNTARQIAPSAGATSQEQPGPLTVSNVPAGTHARATTLTSQPPAGKYTDGSYTGLAANAYYGMVQVQAIVKNGALIDVQFLQHPTMHDTSRYINAQAMPMLTREALKAQSAQVSGVSGATETSDAFKQSLASALSQA